MIRYIISRSNLLDANFADVRIESTTEVLQREDEDLLVAVLRNMVA